MWDVKRENEMINNSGYVIPAVSSQENIYDSGNVLWMESRQGRFLH